MQIERLYGASDETVIQLAELLLDAIDGGASISFMPGLTTEDAASWWQKTLEASSPRTVILVARDESGGVVGTVQLQPAWAPNQPHRGDVAKLVVHRRAREKGIARALMEELERHARHQNFTLLVLDTCRGTPAEQLYESLGWIRVGVVPHYALNPDGSPCDTVFFYKNL